ncbi:hypothetical protein M3Y97_00127200 [Aphelenchoides bicaudatus]|nr:hypothetical protein M3Y97_00127200 [Aphelenchoides bicaudatus]
MSDMDCNLDNGRGLPRSLAEDPFFQYHHQRNSPSAEYFRDFPPHAGGPTRRFGSNPRLYDNVDPRFFDDFDQQNGAFNSLPRRNSQSNRHSNRSPRPPSSAERQVPVRHSTPNPIPLPPPSPQPPRKTQPAETEQPHHQKPPTVNIVNVHPAVEINNSPPSSYTNGKLNPDRANADNVSTNSEDVSAASDHSTSEHTRETNSTPVSQNDAPSANLSVNGHVTNGTTQNGAETKRATFDRKISIDECGNQLINLLDEAEARVEQLRESAAKLEIEKEQLLDILSNLKLNTEVMRLGEGEKEDITATTDRILKRCKAVDVVVNTPRSEEQSRALEEVNNSIQTVVQKMQGDLNASKDDCFQILEKYLNACSADEPTGPIDQRFQSKIIECTADDQKKIRRKLAQIIAQVDRAERTVAPNF